MRSPGLHAAPRNQRAGPGGNVARVWRQPNCARRLVMGPQQDLASAQGPAAGRTSGSTPTAGVAPTTATIHTIGPIEPRRARRVGQKRPFLRHAERWSTTSATDSTSGQLSSSVTASPCHHAGHHNHNCREQQRPTPATIEDAQPQRESNHYGHQNCLSRPRSKSHQRNIAHRPPRPSSSRHTKQFGQAAPPEFALRMS